MESDFLRGYTHPSAEHQYRRINDRQQDLEIALGAHGIGNSGLSGSCQYHETPAQLEYTDYTSNQFCPGDPILGSYINGLIVCGSYDIESMEQIAQMYLDKTPFLERAEPLVEGLYKRTVPYEQCDPDVRRARDFLQGVVNTLAPELQKREMAVLCYGSVLYNDPRNLDYDITFITKRRSEDDYKFVKEIDYYLDKEWADRVGREYSGGNASLDSINELEEVQLATERYDLGWIYENTERIEGVGSFGICVTGSALFTPSPEFLEDISQVVQTYAEKNPLIAGAIIEELHGALETRKERAEQKRALHQVSLHQY